MTDDLANAMHEVFTPEEFARFRKDVEYGRVSFITIREDPESEVDVSETSELADWCEQRKKYLDRTNAFDKETWIKYTAIATELRRLEKETLDLHQAGCEESERATALQNSVEQHVETLRGIASMDEFEGDRMKLWATDGLSGDAEPLESTIKKLSDRIIELEAAIENAPSPDCNLIVFEGCDVCAVTPEDLEELKVVLAKEPTDG